MVFSDRVTLAMLCFKNLTYTPMAYIILYETISESILIIKKEKHYPFTKISNSIDLFQ